MFLAILPGVITPTVSHLFFQLYVIERRISRTLSYLMEFPFDYVPRSLFIGKGLILGWISLDEMETNFISRNNGQFSSIKLLVICSNPVAYTLSLYVYIHEAFIILSCYLNCGLT